MFVMCARGVRMLPGLSLIMMPLMPVLSVALPVVSVASTVARQERCESGPSWSSSNHEDRRIDFHCD